MLIRFSKDKLLDIVFLTVLSVIIFVVFYCLTSIGGTIIGNDGSVHLYRAREFLSTGQISLANIGWTPPLYQLLLTFLIALTGATNIDQFILLVKVSAVLVNWLMFFSVYLIGARLFNKKTGAVATFLLFFCFPMFEMNMWGGYTSVLGIAFMLLLFLYLPFSVEHKSYLIIVGISAFILALSHQLALFVGALILVPVLLFMIIKSRGKGIKALVFIIVGGGFSFFLYYVRAMLPYLGGLIEHVFFAQKAMAYQIPQITLSAFWSNFGFVLILGVVGLFVSVYKLWLEKKHVFNLTLVLSFVIPLILTQSYVFGLYLPFQWFVYYIMPVMVLFAAVFLFFMVDSSLNYYRLHRASIKRGYVKAVVIGLIVLSSVTVVTRVDMLSPRIGGAITMYTTSDSLSLQVGQWLKTNYPEPVTVVVTEAPGFWFSAFCEKDVIVEINPTVERNVVSESVLALSYEIETPLTLIRAYEAKGDISSEYCVSVNDVWKREAFSSIAGDYISYNIGNTNKIVHLSQMERYFALDTSKEVCLLTTIYANNDVLVSQTQAVQPSSYATQITWNIAPVSGPVSNVTLYMSTFFDLTYTFDKVYLPGVLNWENPWVNPTATSHTEWAVTEFSKTNLTSNCMVLHDKKNSLFYAMQFQDLPNWGNIGALGNMQIDAIRLSYTFEQISPDKAVSFSYQILTFAEESYHQAVQPYQIEELFSTQPAEYFVIDSRDYLKFIEENNIGFIVYDKNKLDPNMVRCNSLDLVYSNDRYMVFRVIK